MMHGETDHATIKFEQKTVIMVKELAGFSFDQSQVGFRGISNGSPGARFAPYAVQRSFAPNIPKQKLPERAVQPALDGICCVQWIIQNDPCWSCSSLKVQENYKD